MTHDDFKRIVSIVKSSYRADWLDNMDVLNAFFNFCLQYDYDTCKTAIIDLIENGADEGAPVTLAVIETKIKREARIRQTPTAQRTANVCKACGGRGYILKTYPTGADYWRPCNCDIGREKYKWWFCSQEEEKAYWDEQQRHGISKPNFFGPTPYEVSRQAKYDETQTAVYAEKKKVRASSGNRISGTRTQVH